MTKSSVVELKQYFERRLERTRNLTAGKPGEVENLFGGLMREVLWLTEDTLRKLYGPQHFELSVFIDRKYPRIASYYDSARNFEPRSAEERVQNPNYYRERNYKVVELLDKRPGGVRIIEDTDRDDYEATTEQREKIGSTILYCFDTRRPAALVATSNVRSQFKNDDENLHELIRTVAMAINADLELRSRLPLRGNGSVSGRRTAFSWLHVSDLHFGANPSTHRYDRKAVGRAIINDVSAHVENEVFRPDAMIVTGDIAFRASPEEYAEAAVWLEQLSTAARVSRDSVFLVPGNHDVDRAAADGAISSLMHKQYRNEPAEIDRGLADNKAREALLEKLNNFDRFLRVHFPNHPRGANDSCIDWTFKRTVTHDVRQLRLRLAGLSTVWVSDSLDGRRSKDVPDFVPNMVLARQQLESTLGDTESDEVVFVLTHHPPDWLLPTCQQEFLRYQANRSCLHFCGHVHRKQALSERQLGDNGPRLRYVAGAGHDEYGSPTSEHSYAWGALRWGSDTWELGWAPRVYVRERDAMRADHNRYDLEEDGFVWASVPWR